MSRYNTMTDEEIDPPKILRANRIIESLKNAEREKAKDEIIRDLQGVVITLEAKSCT